jgi:asparagine synthase (glutamine-hydrolysing)
MFDVLRADRTISHFGLEARVPFLDKEFVYNYMQLPPEMRLARDGIEKWLIRNAFAGIDLIPESVLMRRKEAFSDGVSAAVAGKSWHEIIKAHVNGVVRDAEYKSAVTAKQLMEPYSKEQCYYWKCFRSAYPTQKSGAAYLWMPKFSDSQLSDPSARELSHYSGN